jgi:DNA recombination protein RmuC
MEYIDVIIGIFVGAIAGILVGRLLYQQKNAASVAGSALLNERITRLESDLLIEREEAKRLFGELSAANMQVEEAKTRVEVQKEELVEMKRVFSLEFEKLANKIFEEKSTKFKADNKEGLDALLTPLKERIKEFEAKVDKTYLNDTKERAELKAELEQLMKLNNQLSSDAKNLTEALKGESKTQGNWGELVLERILESSGLTEGREFVTQHSSTDADGRRLQPDVIINLPDDKHLIIDSKVSLVDYERFVSAEDNVEKEKALKGHLLSIRNHIRSLSEKEYQHVKDLSSPDFVLLFVPIESSFGVAIQADHELFEFAWKRKIVIVSPSTLLATLRTIASVWKKEHQTQNVLEIARLAGRLYDKFVAFTEDMTQVGDRIDKVQKSYDSAMNKLATGKDNMVRIAEKTRDLGAESKKRISTGLVGQSINDTDE